MADESQISKFYARKKILITGGTGLMGKVLIWKLLQSCADLDTIFVLMRSKRSKNSMSRKEEIFGAPIFDNIKRDNREILGKVVFISGDVGEEGVGLSNKDRDVLINDVSIIFHSAAILKMDASLHKAINVNTVGTVRMLDMAQRMKKLEAFVHISTAFCCCDKSTVEEKIYPSKHNPHDIINLTQWIDPELLEKITPNLIHPLPNTYIYSKRLTESLLQDYVSKVPIIIARPSIVIPSYEEPLPGWNDNLNGPVGLFIAAGKGVMRTSMMNVDIKSDMIPVDFAINSLLALPWANPKEQLLKEISVYNVSQTAYDNLTWREMIQMFRDAFSRYPIEVVLWYRSHDPITKSRLVYTLKCIFLHYLPAYVIDFILMLIGKKTFLVRVHDKLRQGEKVLRYFSQQQWVFLHDKLLQLENIMNDLDRRIFYVNMNVVKDPQDYVDNAIIGSKVYILKESMNTINKAKRIRNIMYIIDKVFVVVRYALFWKIFIFMLNLFLEALQI